MSGAKPKKTIKKIVKHITYNNTINNYYSPQPGSAPAPEAQPERTPTLFAAKNKAVKVHAAAAKEAVRGQKRLGKRKACSDSDSE